MTTVGQGTNPDQIFEWDGTKKIPIATPASGGGGGVAEQTYAVSSGESARTLNAPNGTTSLVRATALVISTSFTLARMGLYFSTTGDATRTVALGVYEYPGAGGTDPSIATLLEQSDYTQIQNMENGQALPNNTPGARTLALRNPVNLNGEALYFFVLSARTNATQLLSLDNRLVSGAAPVFAITADDFSPTSTEMNPTITVDPSAMPGPNNDQASDYRIWMIGLS